MTNEKVYAMQFATVYPLLINKAVRKGRTRAEVERATSWLTGYTSEQLDSLLNSTITYREFFERAPAMNPQRTLITGSICGIRIGNIEEPLMQEIRRLDKLVDDLAKGKPMEKVLR